MVLAPARRSLTRRSWSVPKARSTRPLAWGGAGGDGSDVQVPQGPAELGLGLGPALEPGVFAGVHLDQFPERGPPRTPGVMAEAAARPPQPGLDHPLPPPLAADCEAVAFGQLLGRPRVAEVAVPGLDQRHRPPGGHLRHPAVRRPSPGPGGCPGSGPAARAECTGEPRPCKKPCGISAAPTRTKWKRNRGRQPGRAGRPLTPGGAKRTLW